MGGDETPKRTWTVRKAVWVILAHLIVLPFSIYALRDLDTENNVETWLPADDPHAIVLDWYRDEFGLDLGMLISWDDSTLNDPRVETLAEALAGPVNEQGHRTAPLPGIDKVRTPREVIRRMIENKVPREEALLRSAGLLVGTGPLKVVLTDAGRSQMKDIVQQVTAAGRDELDIEIVTLLPAKDRFIPDETEMREGEVEADEFSGPSADDPYPDLPPHDFQLRWKDMVPQANSTRRVRELLEAMTSKAGEPLVESTFFVVGAPVAVSVTFTDEGDQRIEEMVDLVRETALKIGVPEPELHMGGSPVGRTALNRSTMTSSWNTKYPWWNLPMRSPLLTSALVGLGVALAVLRSVRLAALVIVTAIYVALVATSLVPASGRNLNMVLLVMPNLLIVLTTSGAIHVANYWRHVAQDGLDGAIESAVQMARQPCTLASVTTAIGLTSLLTSVLSPVQEFGGFSAIGCLISLAVVLWGFPSLLRLWRGEAPTAKQADTSAWRAFGHWLYKHGNLVSLSCIVIFIVSVLGLRHFKTETKVIKYFPEHTRIMADYRFLEENLSGIVPVDVVVAFDDEARESLDAIERMELVRQIEEDIATHPEISGTLSLADFRMPTEPVDDNAPRLVAMRYNRTVNELQKYLDATTPEESGRMIATADRPLSLAYAGRQVDIPSGTELWRVRAQVAVLSDLDYTELTSHMEVVVAKRLAEHPGTFYVVTGTVPLFLRTQDAVLESLIRSFALAFGVIAIVMMILLRNIPAGLLTMLPNLLPVGVVFGLISWAGVPVDIGTMITASVALGIAIDGTLHLLTWFRDGLRNGMSREDAIALGLAHCGPAMWQTSAAIGFGLLMMINTELLLISRFGWLMASLILAALIADIVFLPALLAGPLGRLIERNIPRTHQPSTVSAEAVPDPSKPAAAPVESH